MKHRLWILFAACLVLLLAACTAPASQAANPQDASLPTPESGKGAIAGQLLSAAERWPDEEIIVYAASYAPVDGGGGMFTLEPYLAPQAVAAADGSFHINNIPPGDYVLVVGPEPARGHLVVGDNDQTRVFTVTTEILQAGELTIAR